MMNMQALLKQAYAMQNLFDTDFSEAEIINYRPLYKKNILCNFIRYVCSIITNIFPKILPAILHFRAYNFQRKYLKQSELCYTFQDLKKIVNNYDIIICGSDQIWAPNSVTKEYLLNFVPDGLPKYSYAASIGFNYIPKTLFQLYKDNLLRFKAISVREQQGCNLLNEILENKVYICDVLDPTLMIQQNDWDKILVNINYTFHKKFVFCYFLGNNIWHRQYALNWARKNHYSIIIYSFEKKDKIYSDKQLHYIGPQEFLNYLKNSIHVFTDSFHGMAMSVVYKKDFNIFLRFSHNDPKCQNSRIFNMLNKLSLNQFLINENDSIDKPQHIDYSTINNLLNKEKEKSNNYIKTILNTNNNDKIN